MKNFTYIIAFNTHNNVHSPKRYLFCTYSVPGTMLGARDKVDRKAGTALVPKEHMV